VTGAAQILMSGVTVTGGGGGGGGGGGDPAPPPMTVILDTTIANGAEVAANGATITTNTVSASIANGTAPYTAVWTLTTSAGITTISPNSLATAFRKTNTIGGQSYTGTAVLTVTDANSQVADSSTVNVYIENIR
jgi:hypothetical protein